MKRGPKSPSRSQARIASSMLHRRRVHGGELRRSANRLRGPEGPCSRARRSSSPNSRPTLASFASSPICSALIRKMVILSISSPSEHGAEITRRRGAARGERRDFKPPWLRTRRSRRRAVAGERGASSGTRANRRVRSSSAIPRRSSARPRPAAPSAPARWAIDVSQVTMRSSAVIAAAVSTKASGPASKSAPSVSTAHRPAADWRAAPRRRPSAAK